MPQVRLVNSGLPAAFENAEEEKKSVRGGYRNSMYMSWSPQPWGPRQSREGSFVSKDPSYHAFGQIFRKRPKGKETESSLFRVSNFDTYKKKKKCI